MLGMNMTEEMGFQIKCRQPIKDFFRTIVDVVVEVKDSVCRRVGNQNVGVGWDFCIIAALTV